jgi:hypothetical protein
MVIVDSVCAFSPQEMVQVYPSIVTRGRDLFEGAWAMSRDASSSSSGCPGMPWTLKGSTQERLATLDQD